MKLSIIVPIYNAEAYIKDCLASIICCDYKEMECILVDDGSEDSSISICKEYCQRDSRFRLYCQSNKGVSSARNLGIYHATGTYCMFLDADDYMKASAWDLILEQVEQERNDFIVFSYLTLFHQNQVVEEHYEIEEQTEQRERIDELMYASSRLNTCWGKLFLRDIITNNYLRFDTQFKIGEDYIFVAEFYQQCTSPLIMNQPVLYYRQHRKSAMRKYNLDVRLSYTQQLYTMNLYWVEKKDNPLLLSKMYNYYFRVLTNLLLEFGKKDKVTMIYHTYKSALQQEFVDDIMGHVLMKQVPIYKKLECFLLKKRRYYCLATYFKVKSCFAK